MKLLMLLSLALSFNVYAQTETQDELTLADEAIESPTLNIEGQYQVAEPTPAPAPAPVKRQVVVPPPVPPRQLSASEKLRKYRERLEERNRIMVEKKMEQIRWQQEMALARKLEASMNQTLKAIDNIE